MARDYPVNPNQFSRVPGVGAAKLNEFGSVFTEVVREYLALHPKQTFVAETDRRAMAGMHIGK
jgi:hypothetical protein